MKAIHKARLLSMKRARAQRNKPLLENNPQVRADVLAGEASANTLAARYGVSRRQVCRWRAALRHELQRAVRTPDPKEF